MSKQIYQDNYNFGGPLFWAIVLEITVLIRKCLETLSLDVGQIVDNFPLERPVDHQ